MFIPNAIAVRRRIYLEAGGQPSHLYVSEDYSMCIGIAKIAKVSCSNKKLNWYRQSQKENLMRSRSAYYGPPRALADELQKIAGASALLNTYDKGSRRLQKLCNMLFRNDWVNADRKSFNQHSNEFRPLLSGWLLLKWQVIWLFVPPVIGRWIRSIKRGLTIQL